jgi:transcription termination factor Rho
LTENANGAAAATGVLELWEKTGGFLRDPGRSFAPSHSDVWVSPGLIREHGLVPGAFVEGPVAETDRGPVLESVAAVCGLEPKKFQARTRFDKMDAVNPSERIPLGDFGNASMRAVDLIAPIGKGTRGLIVAQPKSGKTRLLEDLAHAIRASEPAARLIVLLIDERPEEVTHFRRGVDAEVLASSSDQDGDTHVRLTELVLAHVRTELECGRDTVVLVDSLTRMARAFNRAAPSAGRTLSGGLDARALEVPRRFFGLARKVESGGSVTVIATAIVGTGSRMDDYVFEEFKGTGNSEIVLDRSLAEARIFPAIDIAASGTRREELLVGESEMIGLSALRRRWAERDSKTAMLDLLGMLKTTKTNEELLRKAASGM